MFKKNLCLFIFALAFFNISSCQNKQNPPFETCFDSLSIVVNAIEVKNNKATSKACSPVLSYDFDTQYPFYKIKDKTWNMNEQFQLKFNSLPDSGFLYIFSMDAADNYKFQHYINLDSLSSSKPITLPNDTAAYTIEKIGGTEHLCIWYSTSKINDFIKLSGGIEMLFGKFMKRTLLQVGGSNILYPNMSWQLLSNSFGFCFKNSTVSNKKNYILPLIIDFETAKPKKIK